MILTHDDNFVSLICSEVPWLWTFYSRGQTWEGGGGVPRILEQPSVLKLYDWPSQACSLEILVQAQTGFEHTTTCSPDQYHNHSAKLPPALLEVM